MSAPIRVLYFAWLRERIGHAEEEVDDAPATVAALLDALRARSPAHAAALADASVIRCAVNQDFASAETRLSPGDEVALFPPVTGG